jgi:UDP-N-acetylmuramate--alanine ligase
MKVHFIGIGGIGISALACFYLQKGYKVSGSDLFSSEITDELKEKGVKIFIGPHKEENLPKGVSLVIHSQAINQTNPELIKAKDLKIETKSYPQALGELTKNYFTIAVSGTHGKSTTTAMISLIMIKAGFDPTVIVGTKLKEFDNSNYRAGNSQYLVIEADEHFASFLNYWPKIIVLTNIEKEHLDYYKNLKNILRTYKEYISHLQEDGVLILNSDDKNSLKLKVKSAKIKFKIKNYTLKQPEAKPLKKILKIPGEHNVANALAALTVARTLKIPDKTTFKALSEYKGSWRRFEIAETLYPKPLTLISDYAHHPTEIEVTLKAAREKYPKRKIWCVFQPHQYQRTYYLFNEFIKVFRKVPVDMLIITDIFDVAGREDKKIKEKISSKKLVDKIKRKLAIYLPSDKIINYLKDKIGGNEVIIFMGAGDIYKLSSKLKDQDLK